MYPFLISALGGVGWSRSRTFRHSLANGPCAHYRGRWVRPMARFDRYGEEKNLLSRIVFTPQTVPPAQSTGRINDEFGKYGWK
jgi:hypothetical protein